MKELKIGNLVAKIPIIQGGMGIGVSRACLAASVANEGGIGVIATPGLGLYEPDGKENFIEANNRAMRKEIKKARELTKGIIGVNIMVALSNFAELAKTAVNEEIDIIFSGAGLPLNLPMLLFPGSKTKLVPIVSSGRAASLICKRWKEKFDYLPDAIVVEGPLAGGHLGFKLEQIDDPDYSLEKLVPEVIGAVKPFETKYKKNIPIIAAGGIYTGEDIHRFLQMGASGVQMATRFVTTYECDAAHDFKQAYIDAKKDDIVIIKSPVGMPGRAIKNKFIEAVNRGEKQPFHCPYHCIITCDVENSPYCIAIVLFYAQKGNFDHGFAFAGANAYRAKEIISVKRLISDLKEEYEAASCKK